MAAFSDKLERCPSDTVSRCTPVQIRDAFVKMILGKEEHHLADFLHCANYLEAASGGSRSDTDWKRLFEDLNAAIVTIIVNVATKVMVLVNSATADMMASARERARDIGVIILPSSDTKSVHIWKGESVCVLLDSCLLVRRCLDAS